MRRTRFFLLLALGLGLPGGAAMGDTLLVESVQSAPDVSTPARGASMEQVLAQYGDPLERHGPVGEPPISYWNYGNFVVYFEHQTVLHSVIPHK